MLKTINYRGELLKFNIPKNWIEEYDKNNGGAFYEDKPRSPTLRVNVLTFQAPHKLEEGDTNLLASISKKFGKKVIVLENLNTMVSYLTHTKEAGEKIVIYYWSLGNIIPPNTGRIVNFSLTIFSDQIKNKKIKETIQLLENEIKKCIISKTTDSL